MIMSAWTQHQFHALHLPSHVCSAQAPSLRMKPQRETAGPRGLVTLDVLATQPHCSPTCWSDPGHGIPPGPLPSLGSPSPPWPLGLWVGRTSCPCSVPGESRFLAGSL